MNFDPRTMIEAGVDVNSANHQGVTPLMAAAKIGDAGLVRHLIAHGATSEAKDKRNLRAFDYASTSETRALLSVNASHPKDLRETNYL